MLLTMTRLPSIQLEPDRVICGAFVQFVDNRGGWILHETKKPLPKDHEYLALGTRRAVQRFVDGRPEVIAEVPDGPALPDVDELNAAIPEDEWQTGLAGKPEPPWRQEFVLYALDLDALSVITFANSTIGAMRAVTEIESRWDWARALYGDDVRPLLKLADAPFPTSFGERKRPFFEVTGWRRFRDGALCAVDHNITAIDAPRPRPAAETVNDVIPY
jgi:hypothetical protein